jgi:hypothetical protein
MEDKGNQESTSTKEELARSASLASNSQASPEFGAFLELLGRLLAAAWIVESKRG